MKKLLFVFVFALPLSAQEFPRVELFGGYALSNVQAEEQFNVKRQFFHGWGASVTGNVTRSVGVAFHTGGAYGGYDVDVPVGNGFSRVPFDSNVHLLLGGPELSLRGGGVRGFFHTLLGLSLFRSSIDSGPGVSAFSSKDTAFAWALGGGLDIGSGRLGVRLIQFDYVGANTRGFLATHNVRVATGIVFRF